MFGLFGCRTRGAIQQRLRTQINAYATGDGFAGIRGEWYATYDLPLTCMDKSIFASKTFWFNALTVVVVIAAALGYAPNQELAEQTSQYLVAFAPVVNIILRMVTKSSVHL